MQAAKAWHLTPSQFYAQSGMDQAVMVQTLLTEQGMAAYEAEIARQESEARMGGLRR